MPKRIHQTGPRRRAESLRKSASRFSRNLANVPPAKRGAVAKRYWENKESAVDRAVPRAVIERRTRNRHAALQNVRLALQDAASSGYSHANANAVIVFGSAAQGKARLNDIDVVVLCDNYLLKDAVGMELAHFISQRTGIRAHPIVPLIGRIEDHEVLKACLNRIWIERGIFTSAPKNEGMNLKPWDVVSLDDRNARLVEQAIREIREENAAEIKRQKRLAKKARKAGNENAR